MFLMAVNISHVLDVSTCAHLSVNETCTCTFFQMIFKGFSKGVSRGSSHCLVSLLAFRKGYCITFGFIQSEVNFGEIS